MAEKLKVNISKELYSVLHLDAELFEFYHRKGDVNMNKFLNRVILHTYQEFDQKREERFQEVYKLLKRDLGYHGLSDDELRQTAWEVTDTYFDSDDNKNEKVVRLTTTQEYDEAGFSDKYLLDGIQPPSSYLRSIFIYYKNKPRYERERIVFSNIYQTLEEAIKEKRAVAIKLSIRPETFTVIPYKIAFSKEELFNYLICEEVIDQKPTIFSMRLMRMVSVVKKGPAKVTESLIPLMERTIYHGPMFSIKEDEEIAIELTKEGIRRYQHSTIYRPDYFKKEKNIYYFNCSASQIISYFSSFGEHAKILAPKHLKEHFTTLYQKGYSKYK